MKTREGNYKGNATITLDPDGKWPFSFGVSKAKLVIENIDAIRAFVTKHSGGQQETKMRDPGEDAADRWNETQS